MLKLPQIAIDWMFQSTPPHGGRQAAGQDPRGVQASFNPRPRTGGDQPKDCTVSYLYYAFQSTPPHGGRRDQAGHLLSWHRVSIHAPARGATRAQGASHVLTRVSIHAPARGATPLGANRFIARIVSIHAPARGATTKPFEYISPTGFNPRPRTGGDPSHGVVDGLDQIVSIHAPARGATAGFNPKDRSFLEFQSTPPHGGRPNDDDATKRGSKFQSTPPHGGRLAVLLPGQRKDVRFNPRPRTGGDQLAARKLEAIEEFQSTPRTGGDPRTKPPSSTPPSFNPRPRTGGDKQYAGAWDNHAHVSIHAPARGATAARGDSQDGVEFQSTPPHGGRRPGAIDKRVVDLVEFQSTPPHGGRRGLHPLAVIPVIVSIHAPARGAT